MAGQFLAVLLGSLPYYLGLTTFFIRRYPDIFRLVISSASALRSSIGREFWNLNWPTFVINVCGRISLMTDNIIIATVLGPTAVASFFLTQRLPILALSQIQGISGSSWPGLVDLYHQGQSETLMLRLIELTKLTVILGISLLLPVVIYNSHFVTLWVGINNFAGELVTILAAVNGLMLAIFSLWTFIFIATGKVSLLMPIVLCSAIINLLLSVLLTSAIGIGGPLLGTFISFSTTYLWGLPWLLQRELGISAWTLLKSITEPFVIGIPFGIFFWYAANNYDSLGWFSLAFEMSLAALLYFALAWLLVLNPSERSEWISRLSRFLPKNK
ncbi:MAG: hypothetical protein NVS2B14_09440 [Chamaesiphon sp.]